MCHRLNFSFPWWSFRPLSLYPFHSYFPPTCVTNVDFGVVVCGTPTSMTIGRTTDAPRCTPWVRVRCYLSHETTWWWVRRLQLNTTVLLKNEVWFFDFPSVRVGNKDPRSLYHTDLSPLKRHPLYGNREVKSTPSLQRYHSSKFRDLQFYLIYRSYHTVKALLNFNKYNQKSEKKFQKKLQISCQEVWHSILDILSVF